MYNNDDIIYKIKQNVVRTVLFCNFLITTVAKLLGSFIKKELQQHRPVADSRCHIYNSIDTGTVQDALEGPGGTNRCTKWIIIFY